MTRQQRRLVVIAAAGAFLALATGLTLVGLQSQITLFVEPSQIAEKAQPGQRVRIGGLVEQGSVARASDGALIFRVTDGAGVLPVTYPGDPPDLFRENQGVVAEGRLRPDGVFAADRILAKHDENYMPKEVAEALKANGEWRGPTKPQTEPTT